MLACRTSNDYSWLRHCLALHCRVCKAQQHYRVSVADSDQQKGRLCSVLARPDCGEWHRRPCAGRLRLRLFAAVGRRCCCWQRAGKQRGFVVAALRQEQAMRKYVCMLFQTFNIKRGPGRAMSILGRHICLCSSPMSIEMWIYMFCSQLFPPESKTNNLHHAG